MRLEGYRCDECKTESRDKPGNWHEVKAIRVSHRPIGVGAGVTMTGTLSASYNDGLHYCSRECLLVAVQKWPKS